MLTLVFGSFLTNTGGTVEIVNTANNPRNPSFMPECVSVVEGFCGGFENPTPPEQVVSGFITAPIPAPLPAALLLTGLAGLFLARRPSGDT
ncbi:MAG: hypothetical protein AAGF71_13225 [Pseudomonadota bacterium]